MARYAVIAGRLKQRIVEGVYAPGAQLPSHRELAAEFNTTLNTVRSSIDVLIDSGWLRVEHGLGTFVADIGTAADVLISFSPSEVEGASALQTEVVGIDMDAPAPPGASVLQLGAEEGLVRIDRLRCADGLPVIHQLSYLPGRFAPVLAEYSAATPLYVFLRDRLRLIATTSREILDVSAPPPHVTATLQAPANAVLMSSRKTSYDDAGAAFLFDQAWIRTDRLPLVIERAGLRSNVHFLSHQADASNLRPAVAVP